MNNPLVSIIIPNYNCEKYLNTAIKSALNQTYNNIEVIVIDDGSTDESKKIISSFGNSIKSIFIKNAGAPVARNIGIKRSSGEYIKFLDSDDILENNAVEIQINLINNIKNESNFIVYGNVLRINEKNNIIGINDYTPTDNQKNNILKMIENNPLTSSPLHKKSYLEDINGFNENLSRGQEYDLHYRLALAGISFIHHSDIIYRYRDYISSTKISSGAFYKYGADFEINYVINHLNLARKFYNDNIPEQIKIALAQQFWKIGRGLLRANYLSHAKKSFLYAKNLSKNNYIVGSSYYKFFCKLFGEIYSEKIFNYLHLINFFKK